MTAAEPSGRGKGRAFIPMPADFPTRGRDMTQAEASEHYGVSIRIVIRWRKEAGFSGKRVQHVTIPADFAEHAPNLSQSMAMRRWNVSQMVVRGWYARAGLAPKGWSARIPETFATVAPSMQIVDLARRYGRNEETIRRWCKHLGVSPKPRPSREVAKARKLNVRGVMCLPAIHRPVARDATREGQAADHLRRLCAVYRCTETGAADAKGGFWRVGFAVLSGAELIARAERKGWNPRAWMEIAA